MASPIRWFRKHSQFFIVVFGVVLMAIFGLGSIMTTLNPADLAGRAQAENPVIAEWSEGELTENDLFRLRQTHFASLRFLQSVYKFAVDQNEGKPFQVSAQQIPPIAMGQPNPTNTTYNNEILNRYLLAQRAKREGFVVDDAMVYQYIAQFGGETQLSRDNLKQLNREVNNNVPLTAIVRHLQLELLWQQMEFMTDAGLAFDTNNQIAMNAISPTEAIELYERANRKIECRILPVSIDEYLTKVGEPGDAEMVSLFEEGKYQYRSLNYDEPGFKQLKKAKVQYFVAELDTFLENEMAKLTDEEVQAEYDRLVEAGDNLVMQIVPKTEDQDEDNGEASDTDAASEEDGEESSDDAEQTDDPAPAPGEDSTNESDGEQQNDANDSKEENAEQVDDSEQVEQDAESQDGETSGGYTSIRIQEEETAEGEGESAQDDQQSNEESDDDPSLQDDAKATEEGELDEESGENTGESNDGNEEPGAEGDQETNAAGAEQDPIIEDDQPEREPKPLKDVAEDIKRRMSTQAAREARDKVVDELEKELRKYQMKINKWEFEKEREKDEDLEKPSVPDFKALADKYAIEFFETDLIDRTQIGDEKIGKVVRFEIVNQRPIQIDIGEDIFDQFETTALFQPAMADDFATSSKFLYWLSEKIDQKVPTFDEAKESIAEYWKRNKAIELAMEDAQKIADELNSDGALLATTQPEKSKDTGAFSWFSTFGRFAYGAPEGVVEPGDEFMGVAFGLEQNQVGVALNEPRDTAYVIQVTSRGTVELEELGTEYLEKNFFLTNQIPREVISAKALYRQRMNFDWLKEFNKTMDIKVIGQ